MLAENLLILGDDLDPTNTDVDSTNSSVRSSVSHSQAGSMYGLNEIGGSQSQSMNSVNTGSRTDAVQVEMERELKSLIALGES